VIPASKTIPTYGQYRKEEKLAEVVSGVPPEPSPYALNEKLGALHAKRFSERNAHSQPFKLPDKYISKRLKGVIEDTPTWQDLLEADKGTDKQRKEVLAEIDALEKGIKWRKKLLVIVENKLKEEYLQMQEEINSRSSSAVTSISRKEEKVGEVGSRISTETSNYVDLNSQDFDEESTSSSVLKERGGFRLGQQDQIKKKLGIMRTRRDGYLRGNISIEIYLRIMSSQIFTEQGNTNILMIIICPPNLKEGRGGLSWIADQMKLEGVAGTIAGSLKYHAVICPTQDPATTRGHQNSIIIGREEGLETAFMVLGAALPESLATISPMRRLHTMARSSG